MTAPTETGYLRYAVIDGKTFIVDAEGRTLGQVVPKEASVAMAKNAQELFGGEVENFVSDYMRIYGRYLSAATVDVSAAVVKVPEREKTNLPQAAVCLRAYQDGKAQPRWKRA